MVSPWECLSMHPTFPMGFHGERGGGGVLTVFPMPSYWEIDFPMVHIGKTSSQCFPTGKTNFPKVSYWGSEFPMVSIGKSSPTVFPILSYWEIWIPNCIHWETDFPMLSYWYSHFPMVSIGNTNQTVFPMLFNWEIDFPIVSIGKTKFPMLSHWDSQFPTVSIGKISPTAFPILSYSETDFPIVSIGKTSSTNKNKYHMLFRWCFWNVENMTSCTSRLTVFQDWSDKAFQGNPPKPT